MTLGDCFRGAWKDAGRSVLSRPILALAVFALLLVPIYFNVELSLAPRDSTLAGLHSLPRARLWVVIGTLVEYSAAAVMAVQVMRITVFSEGTWRAMGCFDSGLRRYVKICVGFGAIVFAILMVVSLATLILVFGLHQSRSSVFPDMLAMIGLVVLAAVCFWVRLSLMFCNAALGGRATWRETLRATRGHFWAITGAHFVTFLPLLLALVVLGILKHALASVVSTDSLIFGLALAQSLVTLASTCVSGACSGWLYRRFGSPLDV